MSADDRRASALLLLGTALGIALAAVGIVRSGGAPAADAERAIAVVNGQPLSREAFARFAAAVAAEREEAELDDGLRERLLSRMIDEELLFQRGVRLGLARHEPTARRAIVAALIASVSADAEVREPSEEELRRFHAESPDRFTRPGRLTLDALFVSTSERADAAAYRRAEEIARRLRAGEDLAAVRAELADEPVAPLPGGPLPFETVRRYLGPTVARAAARLAVGEVGDPLRASDGYHVVRLVDHLPGEVAPFDEIRAQVRAEYLRERGDQALRDYLAELRDGAEIEIYR